ncbi:MAG: ABC transporter ATP-binding protein [Candidatus Eremiobacteraeota bacterium]|nr:ABC transporter ATP-binding protein [Candidatus Eremiobacteraeota bacterium]
MAQIAISNLKKHYAGVYAVDGVELTVQNGEVLALLGPSGCGKTTTLSLLAGFAKPDEGEIRVGERVLSSPSGIVPPEDRHMSLIFQSYAVWPHMTVFENVAYGLGVRKVARSEVAERVERVLDSVHMKHLAQRYPSELSGGQQQRVALARALVVEPDILLLDEPLSNLDANLREQMRFEIRRLHDTTGITMVYVTHDQAEAMVTADRIAIMNLGKVEQVGTPHEIYELPQTAFSASFIGRMNVLAGTLVDECAVQCGPVTVRAASSVELVRGSKAVVCIRPQHVVVGSANGSGPSGTNALSGTIARQTYLGEIRDYLIEIPGGLQLRAVTDPGVVHEVGSEVTLNLPVERCRIVEV